MKKRIVYNKKILFLLFPEMDKKILTQYYHSLKNVSVTINPDQEKLISLKQLFFIKFIINNVEPVEQKIFSVCAVMNIYWELLGYARDLELTYLDVKYEDFQFLIDYFDNKYYNISKAIDKGGVINLPKPYKSFVRDLYLYFCGSSERQAEAKKELDLALENDDVFAAAP
jgi:hypothetical protein